MPNTYMPTAKTTTPVQLKNHGTNARAASAWQKTNPISASIFSFIEALPSGVDRGACMPRWARCATRPDARRLERMWQVLGLPVTGLRDAGEPLVQAPGHDRCDQSSRFGRCELGSLVRA